MKDKIMFLVIGVLVGAICASGVFMIINKNNENNETNSDTPTRGNFRNFDPENMPSMDPNNLPEGFDPENMPQGGPGNFNSNNNSNTNTDSGEEL